MAAGGPVSSGGEAAETAPTLSEHPTRALFGGAMSMAVPCTFADVSDFRPVPDHQEVYADAERDTSVIVEVNEMEDVKDDEAASHHWRDYAAAAGADEGDLELEFQQSLTLEDMPNFAGISEPFKLEGIVGLQRLAKFKEGPEAKNCVRVFMAVIRLPSKRTDISIILNTPVEVSESSSSYKALEEIPDAEDALALFRGFMATFTIHDWAIFGEG